MDRLRDRLVLYQNLYLSFSRLAISREEEPVKPDPSAKVKSFVFSFPQTFAVSSDAPPEKVCLQVINKIIFRATVLVVES
jgi:hypothetical protein